MQVPSPKNIGEWEEQEEELKKLAHMKGGHWKTLHAGKSSRYHQTEGTLRRWLLHRRKRQILVTKKMMIKKAKEVSAAIHALTANQLEDWWAVFRRRRRISARRVSSWGSVSAPGVRRASFLTILHSCLFLPPPHQTILCTFSPCLRIWPILCTQFMTMARVVVRSGGSDILCC